MSMIHRAALVIRSRWNFSPIGVVLKSIGREMAPGRLVAIAGISGLFTAQTVRAICEADIQAHNYPYSMPLQLATAFIGSLGSGCLAAFAVYMCGLAISDLKADLRVAKEALRAGRAYDNIDN